MAEESHENFSNVDPMSAFGLQRSEGENKKQKTKQNDNNAEENGSSKKIERICRGRKQRLTLTALYGDAEH